MAAGNFMLLRIILRRLRESPPVGSTTQTSASKGDAMGKIPARIGRQILGRADMPLLGRAVLMG